MKSSARLYPLVEGGFVPTFDYSGSGKQLKERLEEDGYLYIPSVVSRILCERAMYVIQDYLKKAGMLDEESTVNKLIPRASLSGRSHQGRLKGVENLVQHRDIMAVVENGGIEEVMKTILQQATRSFDYKWLRAVSGGEFTGCHTDSVYVGGGSQKTLTCWIAFMDIPVEMGGLIVCERSHKSPGFQQVRDTYCEMDVDRDNVAGTGWLSEDPDEIIRFGKGDGRWVTHDFKAGDIVIFTLRSFHASGTNQGNNYRVSCDTRWLPRWTESPDPRWVSKDGKPPMGHPKFSADTQYDPAFYPETLEQAKKRWGLI